MKVGSAAPYLACAVALLAAVAWRGTAGPLAPKLVSPDNAVRNAALAKAARLDPAEREKIVPALAAAAASGDESGRRYALYALRKTAPADARSLAVAVETLKGGSDDLSREAEALLSEAGAPGAMAAAPLLGERGRPAQAAERILVALGPEAEPALAAALGNSKPETRRAAARLLRKNDGPARAALHGALTDADAGVRREAALSLGAADAAGWPLLLAIVESGPSADFERAIVALTQAGPKAAFAVPNLRAALLKAPDPFLSDHSPRALLAGALEAIDPRDRAVAALRWDLKDRDPVIRYRAARYWSVSPVEAAVPYLVDALADADAVVGARAAWALSHIGWDKMERFGPKADATLAALLGKCVESDLLPDAVAALAPGLRTIDARIEPPVAAGVSAGRLSPAALAGMWVAWNAGDRIGASARSTNAGQRTAAALAAASLRTGAPDRALHADLDKLARSSDRAVAREAKRLLAASPASSR